MIATLPLSQDSDPLEMLDWLISHASTLPSHLLHVAPPQLRYQGAAGGLGGAVVVVAHPDRGEQVEGRRVAGEQHVDAVAGGA